MTEFAHVSGVPIEELLPLALASGTGMLAAARAWLSTRRDGAGRRETRARHSTRP